MMIPKEIRLKDEELLKRVRLERCAVRDCFREAEAAHIKSRGSGGGDTADNVMPLCKWHHSGEQHVVGWKRFREKHPEVKTYGEILRERGY